MLAKRVDIEAEHAAAVRGRYRLPLEIDRELESGKSRGLVEQAIDLGFAEHDRQQSVLETVIEENVGERRRDDRPESVVAERPGSVLARAAATEIAPCEKDLRALIARLVQREVRIRSTLGRILARFIVIEIAPCVEQVGPEARSTDRLQELLGNDGVGVDIGAIERRHQAGQSAKRLHAQPSSAAGERRRNDLRCPPLQPSPG